MPLYRPDVVNHKYAKLRPENSREMATAFVILLIIFTNFNATNFVLFIIFRRPDPHHQRDIARNRLLSAQKYWRLLNIIGIDYDGVTY
jgi:hypothetical protein